MKKILLVLVMILIIINIGYGEKVEVKLDTSDFDCWKDKDGFTHHHPKVNCCTPKSLEEKNQIIKFEQEIWFICWEDIYGKVHHHPKWSCCEPKKEIK